MTDSTPPSNDYERAEALLAQNASLGLVAGELEQALTELLAFPNNLKSIDDAYALLQSVERHELDAKLTQARDLLRRLIPYVEETNSHWSASRLTSGVSLIEIEAALK